LVFEFLPVKFLQGERLVTWAGAKRTAASLAAMVFVGALITRIVMRDEKLPTDGHDIARAFAAVLLFGVLSLAFWDRYRDKAPDFGVIEEEVVEEERELVGASPAP
jgi:hypothetical protein